MPDKRCPNCNRWNSGAALVCDCGLNFSTGTVSEIPVNDKPSISTSWRVSLTILGTALIPGFILAASLATKLGHLPPLLVALLLAILLTTPFYWLLYFTLPGKAGARYLMLFIGLSGLVAMGFIAVSLVMRIINPQ